MQKLNESVKDLLDSRLEDAAKKFSSISLEESKKPSKVLDTIDKPKVNKSVPEIVNSLIADEFIAWYSYYFLMLGAKGKSLNFLNKIFDENGKDELDDHLNKLVNWMQAKNYQVELDIYKLLQIANCKYEVVGDGMSTKSCIEIMKRAETCSIDAYLAGYEVVKDKEPELGQLFLEIINDEREHYKNLEDIESTWKDYSIQNFSKRLDEVSKKLDKINFSNSNNIIRKSNKTFSISNLEELSKKLDQIKESSKKKDKKPESKSEEKELVTKEDIEKLLDKTNKYSIKYYYKETGVPYLKPTNIEAKTPEEAKEKAIKELQNPEEFDIEKTEVVEVEFAENYKLLNVDFKDLPNELFKSSRISELTKNIGNYFKKFISKELFNNITSIGYIGEGDGIGLEIRLSKGLPINKLTKEFEKIPNFIEISYKGNFAEDTEVSKYDVKQKYEDDKKYLLEDKKNWTTNKKDNPFMKENIAVIDAKIKLLDAKEKVADDEIKEKEDKSHKDAIKRAEENLKKAEELLDKKMGKDNKNVETNVSRAD